MIRAWLDWAWKMPVTLIMAIVGRVLAPVLPLFASKSGWLPAWLWWFQTPDNSLDGDRKHLLRWGTKKDFWHTYVRRVAWLLRNVCYGFDIYVLGLIFDKENQALVVRGNEDISDLKGISGTCVRTLYDKDANVLAFQYYYIKHYSIGSYRACIRLNVGWKLWDWDKEDKSYAQYVGIYFHPIKNLHK